MSSAEGKAVLIHQCEEALVDKAAIHKQNILQ